MLNFYKQFRDFHIFKKFKQLLGDWWNIDILIVVKKDKKLFYENSKPINNPVVKMLLDSNIFKPYFLSSLQPVISKGFGSKPSPQLIPWKQTGLDLIVVPLDFKSQDTSQAFLVATGFFPKKKSELVQALSYLSLSNKAIEQKISALRKLSQADEVYIQKILKVLTEEFFLIFKKRQAEQSEQTTKEIRPTRKYGYMTGESPAMQYIFNVLNKIKKPRELN